METNEMGIITDDDEKKMLRKKMDVEAQSFKQNGASGRYRQLVRLVTSDTSLLISLVISVMVLCYLISQRHIVKVDNGRQAGSSIAVTDQNTIDQTSVRPLDIGEEYKTIVALSPVIIVSWDDETVNIPISTSLQQEQSINDVGSDYETSKNFKNLLTTNYQILPQPQILSINKHPKYLQLIRYIMKRVEKIGISKKSNFIPGLIINGRPVASAKAIESLHQSGKLVEYLKSWGDGVITVEKL